MIMTAYYFQDDPRPTGFCGMTVQLGPPKRRRFLCWLLHRKYRRHSHRKGLGYCANPDCLSTWQERVEQ
jgi:hypothetical protein